MPRAYRLYLQDIVKATDKIIAYLGEHDQAAFEADEQIIDAVMYNLMIIGEAVRNIPPDLKETYSEIDWRRINALRNIITHVYFGIDLKQIWIIVDKYVPQLKIDIEQILSDLDTKDQPESSEGDPEL